ncbi:site-2 protease family protein [Alicyclobacillus fastidiosus]|uniref:Site-2 protease family protein n=1 Tax=Alicyclobacillus fastidiosus TaxID=392011 RepID=A0ABV5AGI0_9BACL|nr:site-2 protease family protein [Alicyclobacillus fastidiosus]WEH11771.1 site-2 protease family protein [Alicyclobacillus fastidiosus]
MIFSRLSSPSYILIIFIVLFSLVIHEFAHAAVADLQGDKTARINGRLTLNPLAHLELLGIIMILFAPIGWARPVPINMNNFKRPRLSMILAVAAGPCANLVLAVLAYFVLSVVHPSYTGLLSTILFDVAQVNVALFAFNIIPLPPLDGSQILRHMLPLKQAIAFSRMDAYGPFILMFLFIVPYFDTWVFEPFVNLLSGVIASWFF